MQGPHPPENADPARLAAALEATMASVKKAGNQMWEQVRRYVTVQGQEVDIDLDAASKTTTEGGIVRLRLAPELGNIRCSKNGTYPGTRLSRRQGKHGGQIWTFSFSAAAKGEYSLLREWVSEGGVAERAPLASARWPPRPPAGRIRSQAGGRTSPDPPRSRATATDPARPHSRDGGPPSNFSRA